MPESTDRSELRAELRRRGLRAHLKHLVDWPPEHVHELLAFFQLPPCECEYAVHQGRGCPRCGTGPHDATTARTVMSGPDRWLAQCNSCGLQWLHLEPV